MKKETKFTLELTEKEVSQILIERFQLIYPDANLSTVRFNIESDPTDESYGHPRQIINGITVEGVIVEKV